jgi:D-aspartate ligase
VQVGARAQRLPAGTQHVAPRVRPRVPRRLPLAVVLGDCDMVRTLGLAGIRSAVVTRSPANYSRYAAERIEWADNWGDPARLLRNVLGYAARCDEPPPLFYQHDGDLAFVSRNREALREGTRFVVGDADLVEQLMDKTRFAGLAERLGLPVPRTAVVRARPGSDAPELPLEFPVIVKPLCRVDLIWKPLAGSSKAIRIDTPEGFRGLWPVLADAECDVVAQELVEGGEDQIESYHAYVDSDGEVAGEFTGRKVRTWPREFGHTTALEITDRDDVRSVGRSCMERLGLRGVAKLDFKRAPDGSLLLLEVNPRFNLWHLPGAVAGVNLPALVYADLAGIERPAVRSRPRAGVCWTVPWHDLRAARSWGTGLGRWAAWQLRCETRHVLSVDDPMPFTRGMLWPRVARRLRRR